MLSSCARKKKDGSGRWGLVTSSQLFDLSKRRADLPWPWETCPQAQPPSPARLGWATYISVGRLNRQRTCQVSGWNFSSHILSQSKYPLLSPSPTVAGGREDVCFWLFWSKPRLPEDVKGRAHFPWGHTHVHSIQPHSFTELRDFQNFYFCFKHIYVGEIIW